MVEKYVTKPKEVTQKIREEIKKVRAEKTRLQLDLKSSDKRRTDFMNTPQHSGKQPIDAKGKSTAAAQRKRNRGLGNDAEKQKFTLVELGKVSYGDLSVGARDDKFNPAELISRNEEEDDSEYQSIIQKFRCPKSVSLTTRKKDPDKNVSTTNKLNKKKALGLSSNISAHLKAV